MMKQRSGTIINISSISALVVNKLTDRHPLSYCVSKAGLTMLTKTLAVEWARYNITANAIAPAYTKTVILNPDPAIRSEMVDGIPMARLGNPEDLISVSLDVDVNEEAAPLKEYSQEYGFDWHFAIAPLEVARALGNLYSAQYLNPPLSPMLVIDRSGEVHQLEYGEKSAETLLETIEPFLSQ